MKSKVCLWTLNVLLISCGMSLEAQRIAATAQNIPGFCSRQPSGPARMMIPLCIKLANAAQALPQSNNGLQRGNQGGTLTTFQIPGDFFSPYPNSISDAGTVTGFTAYLHGFLRARDGTITTFDAPGAVFTESYAINSAGTITGVYSDQNFNAHGFVRDSRGTITSFDVPGACGTEGQAINPSGMVTGFWLDADCLTLRGFVRSPTGQITTFDVPGDLGTNYTLFNNTSDIIDPTGTITGFYFDIDENRTRGYVRAPDGTLTLFDGPCQTCGTSVAGIDAAGVITGNNGASGYFRYPDGTFATFDGPGEDESVITAIAPNGSIAGYARSNLGVLRNPGGQYITFAFPGYIVPPGFASGTNAAVNSAGASTGIYQDPNTFLWIAYVLTPN